jgi:8-oxo-dGTP diphosphatase
MAALLSSEINYCVRCGSRLTRQVQFGQLRPVCPSCNWIYFADPKVAAAALIERNGQVLLVRRAMDPQRGLWTLPAGFVDAGEDPARAVERECLEETGLHVIVTGLFDVIYGQEHARGAHILIVYRVSIIDGDLQPSDDVDQVDFFDRSSLPPLAFSTTQKILFR